MLPLIRNAHHRWMSVNVSTKKPLKLPRLPVPPLRHTLDRYLESIKPFLLEDERLGGETFVVAYNRRVRWAIEFETGLGKILQDRLIELDKKSPNNWLDDNFWLKSAYLEWRAPLLINSNWWLAFLDDDTLRDAEQYPTGFTSAQIRRAAWLTHRTLDFKRKLDSQELHPDTTRTGLWFRASAKRMFNIARIPGRSCDSLSEPTSDSFSRSVLVMVHNWCYSLTVQHLLPDSTVRILEPHDIERGLTQIITDAQSRKDSGDKAFLFGALSADERNRWADNLNYLLALSPRNHVSYRGLVNSLMAISLDDSNYTINSISDAFQKNLDEHSHTIRSTTLNVSNRFFDKPYTLIVDPSSRAGAMGEHSPCDALVPSIVAEYGLVQTVDPSDFPSTSIASEVLWQRLDWDTDEKIIRESEEASLRANAIINDSDNSILWFNNYGSEWIKDIAKLSPDAFIQMALQLAWYRTRGGFTATYETALTRMFDKGRTETIRTLTSESRAFVLAMDDSSLTDDIKIRRLQEAIRKHSILTREAATGRGIDRHLLGLQLLQKSRDGDTPSFFADGLLPRSSRWKLSTSGLSAGHLFQGTGFGTAYPDGYGINYLAGPERIKFGIETKFSSPRTSTQLFKLAIINALTDLYAIYYRSSVLAQSTQIQSHL